MSRSTVALLVIALVVAAGAFLLRMYDQSSAEPTSTTAASSSSTVEASTTSTTAGDSTSSTETTEPTTTTSMPSTTSTVLPPDVEACDLFGDIVVTGRVESNELVEASGMAASRTTADVVWSHNDSRGGPILHAFDPQGTDLGAVEIPDAFAIDWEDMAAGPGPDGTGSYLYVGDIGDNFGIRGGVVNVWRVPDVDPATVDGAFPEAEPIVYAMPDGPYDAEALFVDPIEPAMYIVTKSRSEAFVFKGPLEPTTEGHVMELVTTLFLDAEVSGADITLDGSLIGFRGYRDVWLWTRQSGATIAEALADDPCSAPSPDERQGESIAFDATWSYYTVSEGSNPAVNYVPAGR